MAKKWANVPIDIATYKMMVELGWISKRGGHLYLSELGIEGLMAYCDKVEKEAPEEEIRPEFRAKD